MINWKLRYAGNIIPMGYTKGKDFICHKCISVGDLRHNGYAPSSKKHDLNDCLVCGEDEEK